MDIVNHNINKQERDAIGNTRYNLQGLDFIEKPEVESESKSDPKTDSLELRDRVKTSNRMHYEAQVAVIQQQIGKLEDIREKLGLSQRKICQLLMVDPSAWTRWLKAEENAPPVIWRALQWYLIIQEKIPGLTPQFFVGKDPSVLHQQALSKLQTEVEARQLWTQNLSEELERQNEKWVEQNQSIYKMQSEFRDEVRGLKKDLKFYKFLSATALVAIGLLIFQRWAQK